MWRVDARYKGHPKPEISWMKNGKAITTTERCVINTDHATSTIVIQTVENKDTGSYKITATNKIASDSKDLKLNVIGKYLYQQPRFLLYVYFISQERIFFLFLSLSPYMQTK